MDSKKADRLLDRINALHKSLAPAAGNEISGIERDLMLSYLRQLYEAYQFADIETATVVAPKAKPVPPPAPPQPTAKPVSPPAPAPIAETPPPPAPKATPVAKPVVVTPPPPPTPTVTHQPTYKMDKKVATLFAAQEVKELSDRLSLQPIKDLTRALTINNRVQFANTLFAGNSDLMNSVLKRLNGIGSFDAAKPILADLAKEQDWTDEEKAPVARDFIKLVNRRYA